MGKASLSSIARAYFDTLHVGTSGKTRFADVFLQILLPLLVGAALFCSAALTEGNGLVPFVVGAFSDITAALSIISALLCALAIMVFQLRIQMAADDMEAVATKQETQLVDELFSDVLWAVVCGFAAVVLMIVAGSLGSDTVAAWVLAAVSLAVLLNFCAVTCMCLKRMSVAYSVVSRSWTRRAKRNRASGVKE
ncbi:hypothetical protein [Adlercreutzia equolifaciens]|uniref:hypothetical protein n=1 Tax=Adlercreutzia equolifaciens TaxID=446660 RepID=UPI00204F04A7|nr:hypothetical protein [Adlercreutzia equolifaciens]DAZ34249.1 MAG TPA: hypothetical protein [Caudoviricetes sp.]